MTEDWTKQLRVVLLELAKADETIRYTDLAEAVDVPPPHRIHKLADALEALMAQDQREGRPFTASVVVSKVRNGLPAPGYFECARKLGRYFGPEDGDQARLFHTMERDRLRESVRCQTDEES